MTLAATLLLALSVHGAPARHALIIAVGDYQDSSVPALLGPQRDRRLIREMLIKDAGFKAPHIRELPHSSADLAAIREALADLRVRSKAGDLVFIYLAGHGVRIETTRQGEPDGCDEAFVPYDFDRRAARKTLLLDDELHRHLAALKGRRVVLMADTCHSKTLYRDLAPPRWSPKGRALSLGAKCEQRASAPPLVPGHVHIAASRDDEEAHEVAAGENLEPYGALTYAFVRAVREGAGSIQDAAHLASAEVASACGFLQHSSAFGDSALLRAPLFFARGGRLAPLCSSRSSRLWVELGHSLKESLGGLLSGQRRGLSRRSGTGYAERPFDLRIERAGVGLIALDPFGVVLATVPGHDLPAGRRLLKNVERVFAWRRLQIPRSQFRPRLSLTMANGAGCRTSSRQLHGAIEVGERFCVRYEAEQAGFVTIAAVSPQGTLSVLHEQSKHPSSAGIFGPIVAGAPVGRDTLLLLMADKPIRLPRWSGEERLDRWLQRHLLPGWGGSKTSVLIVKRGGR